MKTKQIIYFSLHAIIPINSSLFPFIPADSHRGFPTLNMSKNFHAQLLMESFWKMFRNLLSIFWNFCQPDHLLIHSTGVCAGVYQKHYPLVLGSGCSPPLGSRCTLGGAAHVIASMHTENEKLPIKEGGSAEHCLASGWGIMRLPFKSFEMKQICQNQLEPDERHLFHIHGMLWLAKAFLNFTVMRQTCYHFSPSGPWRSIHGAIKRFTSYVPKQLISYRLFVFIVAASLCSFFFFFFSFVFWLRRGHELSSPSCRHGSLGSFRAESRGVLWPVALCLTNTARLLLPLHGYLTGCLMNTCAGARLCLSGGRDQYCGQAAFRCFFLKLLTFLNF